MDSNNRGIMTVDLERGAAKPLIPTPPQRNHVVSRTPTDCTSCFQQSSSPTTSNTVDGDMWNKDHTYARASTNTGDNAHPLNQSSNILLVYRLQDMRSLASINFVLALLCLGYCAINMVLILVNYLNSRADALGTVDVVDELTYHLLEFWATFGFALVECVSLVTTPKSLIKIYRSPIVLKLILFFNIVASLVPAVLVTLNREVFEILSHEIEYLNELTMTFVDMVLLWSLLKKDGRSFRGQFVITCAAGSVAFLQLGVYNLLGRREDGDMEGEVPAHYFEFFFEIISSLIAFWFCMDNKNVAEKEIGLILYGSHADCGICSAKSVEFERTYSTTTQVKETKNIPSYGSTEYKS